MKFHELIRKLLLVGISKPDKTVELAQPPEALREIDQIVASRRRVVRAAAEAAGDKYRSAFWAIYLFSALAVLCAALPIALGWDAPGHTLRRFAGLWAVLETLLIGAVGALFVWGNKANWQQKWIDARAEAELLRYLSVVAALLNLGKARQAGNWFARVFDVDPEGSPMLQTHRPALHRTRATGEKQPDRHLGSAFIRRILRSMGRRETAGAGAIPRRNAA